MAYNNLKKTMTILSVRIPTVQGQVWLVQGPTSIAEIKENLFSVCYWDGRNRPYGAYL